MQVCSDVYSAATGSSLLSDETMKLLAEVLYELPDLGDALLRAIGLVCLRVEIHIACIHRSLDELSDVGAASNVSGFQVDDIGQNAAAARFYRLLALLDVDDKEAVEKKDELQQLWLRIANLLSGGTSSLDRSTVLSCLLSQKSQSMCRWFMKMLDNAGLHSLVSRTVATQYSSMCNNSTTPSCHAPASSFNNVTTLCIDNASVSKSEANTVVSDTDVLPSTVNKTEISFNLPSTVNEDIVRVIALSSSSDHHKAWYHLYMTCFERNIHFLDLFLVSNMNLFVVLVSAEHLLCIDLSVFLSWSYMIYCCYFYFCHHHYYYNFATPAALMCIPMY